MYGLLRPALAAVVLASSVLAQTNHTCWPLTSCPTEPALGTSATFNWTQTGTNANVWNTTVGPINYETDGAEFSINGPQQSPTIVSEFYIFWGRVSVIMKAAPGDGIVSSVVLLSADLDEIDWEFLGGNTTHVQTNFFGKGDTSVYDRAVWFPVDNTLAEHNYTTVWTQEVTEWWIDGVMVRNVTFDDPLAMAANTTTVGDRYPQTPMQLKIGNWAGGDPKYNAPGVVQWAGGPVDYSKGPFVQVVASVEVDDFTKGSSYTYSDDSGTWQSIKVATGNSTIANIISKPQGVKADFNSLPKAARIGIVAGAIAIAAVLAILMAFCCIKNRRAGRREKAIADAEWERNLTELQRYKRMMAAEEEIHPRAGFI